MSRASFLHQRGFGLGAGNRSTAADAADDRQPRACILSSGSARGFATTGSSSLAATAFSAGETIGADRYLA